MPRKSVAQTLESRQRILRSASRLMRELGYNGVGIDQIVVDAGMTPGAFYRHFDSKADLFSEVMRDALQTAELNLPAIQTPDDVQRFIDFYLSNKAVRQLGQGCIVAAMSADISRQPGDVRDAAGHYLSLIQSRIESALRPTEGTQAQDIAWRIAAQLIGGVVMARILPQAQAKAALDAVKTVKPVVLGG
jgi:TetR/AcrR family transcriptional regulator, transcriptional repressor for nem operon